MALDSGVSLTHPLPCILTAKVFMMVATLSSPPPGWPPCRPCLTPSQALICPQGRAELQGLVSELPHTGPACLSVLGLPHPHPLTPSSHSPLLTNPAVPAWPPLVTLQGPPIPPAPLPLGSPPLVTPHCLYISTQIWGPREEKGHQEMAELVRAVVFWLPGRHLPELAEFWAERTLGCHPQGTHPSSFIT